MTLILRMNILIIVNFFLMFYKANNKSINLGKSILIQTNYSLIYENIEFVLDKLNYCILLDENNGFLIAKKDALAEEVAGDPKYEDIKWRILEYNSHSATLEEKKATLQELYKKFETIRSELKKTNKCLENNLGGLSQCIRHVKNQKKEKKYAFYYENEEKWCDKIYDLFLESFIHISNKSILDEITKKSQM